MWWFAWCVPETTRFILFFKSSVNIVLYLIDFWLFLNQNLSSFHLNLCEIIVHFDLSKTTFWSLSQWIVGRVSYLFQIEQGMVNLIIVSMLLHFQWHRECFMRQPWVWVINFSELNLGHHLLEYCIVQCPPCNYYQLDQNTKSDHFIVR